ncbi:outer membrane protein [Shewanella intestini]|uniref:Porin family protein n=1 Tax=Shewanella intestini TaxID=2017544 RepID=A0ABS5HXF0_9GAMM|nr:MULTISPECIES: outer membrane beta-barrel protein [Shewanella]MBR9726414.1 porin family protein [Shewanella intestini]MRG35020.1 outer membrane beta-barrel protein [Shewanella sp. XMDDZSB0408]
MIKKAAPSLIVLLLAPNIASAEMFVAPFGGYSFASSKLDVVDQNDTSSTLSIKESDHLGVMLGVTTKDPGNIYVMYSQQSTQIGTHWGSSNPISDVDIHYYHVGGTLFFSYDNLKPYVTASVGVTQLRPNAGFSNESRFSMAVGGGIKYHLSKKVALFAEVKAYATLFNSSSTLFCDATNCAWNIKGDVMWQSQANAGLSFSF